MITVEDNGYGMNYWEGKQYHRLGISSHQNQSSGTIGAARGQSQ